MGAIMFQVLLVNGRTIWVDPAGARDLQQEGKILYVIEEKDRRMMSKTHSVPNIFENLSIQ